MTDLEMKTSHLVSLTMKDNMADTPTFPLPPQSSI